MGLGLAVDDFELDPDPLPNRRDEGRPVGGRAAGLGGDGAGPGHAPRRHLVAAHLQRLERARDRRFAQATGQRQPFAQANDARERIDDPESLGGRPRHQQPAIVGAQIQRRISPAPAIAGAGRLAFGTRKRRAKPGLRTPRRDLTQTNPRRRRRRPRRHLSNECSNPGGGCNAVAAAHDLKNG